MRPIDADKIVEVAEHAYGEWNKGMAAAEGRQINRCFKMQELCKAVKAVADDCPTIDPETLRPTAEWELSDLAELKDGEFIHYPNMAIRCSNCLYSFEKSTLEYRNYCPNCGARMVNEDE